ncbi:hypothetical protein BCR44DRAFT_1178204 [Catenaria anguillulae PL171]|uniref:Autophagy-related protein 2 n=1 Tax=Catenaria anguillulae PL171 TaxID=765915 RepID=A0A1Y2HHZ4_9FUNG|nr:hypothetical protein BCR44DRAFT_1178204 [Catenaria anguillulae PL171]
MHPRHSCRLALEHQRLPSTPLRDSTMWPSSILPSSLSLNLNLVPASLQKRLARFLLKRALGSVLLLNNHQFDLDSQIDVSLHGLSLRDVHLNLESLNQALRSANLPLNATRGVLGSVSVTVPWLDLSGSSCTVQLDGVQLELSPVAIPDNDLDDNDHSSASSSTSSNSSPSSSAALRDHSPHAAMLASSIYMANEFLRQGGGGGGGAPPRLRLRPLRNPTLPNRWLHPFRRTLLPPHQGSRASNCLPASSTPIIANLVIQISNVSVTLTNHPTVPHTPSLAMEIPSITVDRAPRPFSKRPNAFPFHSFASVQLATVTVTATRRTQSFGHPNPW